MIPISPEDVGIKLAPVIIPGYFVYADGLRNVTVRDTEGSGVLWRHNDFGIHAPRRLRHRKSLFGL